MIRLMTAADVPAAMRLKASPGWNQTEQDWANILALEPEGCWVYEAEGQVAGSTTAICYGQDMAWIGMVLVLPEFRRRGIGRMLMEHALRFLDDRKVRVVRLDATDMGRPLYEQLGFQEESPIERWAAQSTRAPGPHPPLALRVRGEVSQLAEMDHRAFGVDRTAVLQRLLDCFPAQCLSGAGGYVMSRPGSSAHFVGPCVASDAGIAHTLIAVAVGSRTGEPVFWDLLPQNSDAVELAQYLGFERRRRLVRMVLGEKEHREATRGEPGLQFATAGFEFG